MYNESLKLEYVATKNEEVILPYNYLKCQFNKTEEFEKELNKDLSNWNVYDITEYYKMLNLASLDSLIVMNSQFAMYTNYCLQNNLIHDNQNHFLEINNEILKGCINSLSVKKKIVDRKTVLAWVDELVNPRDQFILLGLFEGIKGKDFHQLVNLTPEDVNGNEITLTSDKGEKYTITVSDKLISIIDDCISETTYYSITGDCEKAVKLIENGKIIKDYPNVKRDVSAFQLGRRVFNAILRILDYVGMAEYMTSNAIYESGRLYAIISKAKENNVTPREIIYSSDMKPIEHVYGNIVKSTFCVKYEDILNV